MITKKVLWFISQVSYLLAIIILLAFTRKNNFPNPRVSVLIALILSLSFIQQSYGQERQLDIKSLGEPSAILVERKPLKGADLSGCFFSMCKLEDLRKEADAIWLNVVGVVLGANELDCISQMRSLQRLNCAHAVISAKDFSLLGRLNSLRMLYLAGAEGINDTQIASLSTLRELVFLSLSNTNVTDMGLPQLIKLPQLTSLFLSGTKITDGGAASLRLLTSLKQLDVSNTGITGLSFTASMPHLESLSVQDNKLGKKSLLDLKSNGNLKRLNASNTSIPDGLVRSLGQLENLEWLNISNNVITDSSIIHLGNLTRLETLLLRNTKIDGTGFANLHQLDSLRVLAVGPQITASGLKSMCGIASILALDLSGNKALNDDSLVSLTALKQLKALTLNDVGITDAAIKTLGSLQNLRFLDVRGTNISCASLNKLHARIPECVILADDGVYRNVNGQFNSLMGETVALTNRVRDYLYNFDFEAAVEILSDALNIARTDTFALSQRALASYLTGRPLDVSLNDLKLSDWIDPSSDSVYTVRSLLNAWTGNCQSAITAQDGYIRIHPNLPEGYVMRGIFESKAGMGLNALYDFAIAEFIKSVGTKSIVDQDAIMKRARQEMECWRNSKSPNQNAQPQ